MANCIIKQIPNAITSCNLICGCIAVGFAMHEHYPSALLFIILGAVFDFFAGTAKRAPLWWQEHSLEWFYRFIIEPRRMWRRYLIGNIEFPLLLAQE